VGAAVGAAVGYLTATDKREQILGELNSIVDKVKDGFSTAVSKYKETKSELIQKAEEAGNVTAE